jgi:3-oxoacyl-[acyl-carrier protein] reductase
VSGRFEGRTALVTGASGGIGQAIARGLAREGARVAAHYASNREPAQRLADDIGATVLQADLRDAEQTEALVDDAERALGPIDVLVANAGIGQRATLEDVDAAMFDATLAANLRAPFLLARRTLPGMRERGYGRILMTSSVAALTGGIVGPHYAASKAGLHGLVHFLAARSAKDGVTVNAIAPALIEDTTMLPGDPGDLASRIPAGRLGKPVEVADLALAMLANGYLTSKIVGIDGGLYPNN